jgi:endonuclease/exonuclease/phosphatase family metal-dependent hydrolase
MFLHRITCFVVLLMFHIILSTTITLGVYNIQTGINMNGRYNLSGTADTISNKLQHLDIIGLQEVDNMTRRHPGHDQTRLLSQLTKFPHFRFDSNRKFQEGDYGNAILSNLVLLETKHLLFSKPNDSSPNRCLVPSPNDYCQGITATLVKKDNFLFWFCTTHFGLSPDENVQFESSRQSLEFIRSLRPNNVVFTGDFNVVPNSRTMSNLLSRSNLRDLWVECKGDGPGYTFNARSPDRRIDYILINFGIKGCKVLVPTSLDSDHRPVWATLEI